MVICFAKYFFVGYLTHYRGVIVTQNIGKINIKKGNFWGGPSIDGVPLGDLKYGIMGITQPEMLHVAGVGIFKYMFSCLSDIIGTKGTKEKEKEQLDLLYQVLTSQSAHQSEKDSPRTSMRNGITNGTNLSGKERVGNMAILFCLTYTKEGRELLMPGLKSNKTSMKDFRHCMKLLLLFSSGCTSQISKGKLTRHNAWWLKC